MKTYLTLYPVRKNDWHLDLSGVKIDTLNGGDLRISINAKDAKQRNEIGDWLWDGGPDFYSIIGTGERFNGQFVYDSMRSEGVIRIQMIKHVETDAKLILIFKKVS